MIRGWLHLSALEKASRDLEQARCSLIEAEWNLANWQGRRDALKAHIKTLQKTMVELTEEKESPQCTKI